MSWQEPLPGFQIPGNWTYDPGRWEDYTEEGYERVLSEAPEVLDLIRFRGIGQPSKRAWGAWLGAQKTGKDLTEGWPELWDIADRMYSNARYVYLVPAWRRAIVGALTEIDDIEDQLSTIIWIAEWVTRKVIPIPPTIMNKADQLRRSLDCAERLLAGVTPFRSGKSEFGNCLRDAKEGAQPSRNRKAGLIAWFQENWARLLEAAQATGTWFDVGIVLGPLFAWLEEGLWGLAQRTVDNYLIAVDALMPGYREDFYNSAAELSAAIQQAWDETWGSGNTIEPDPDDDWAFEY